MPTTGFDLRRLLGASLAVAVLGLGITACGGGGDEEPAPTETATTGTTETVALTTDALIEQGDEICAEVNAALGSIEASTADDKTKDSQISDIYDGLAQQLGELGTPSDGDPPTDVIAAVQDLADGSTDTTALQAAASEYGFTDCADAPEASSFPSDSSSTDSSGSSTGTESTETYTPPATAPEETYTPPATTPQDTGGVAPTTPTTPSTPSTGGSGGTSSGGIGPG